MFWRYPLTQGFKERAIGYSIIMAAISSIAFLFSLFAGDGFFTYFETPIGADFLAFYTGGSFFNQGNLDQVYSLGQEMYFPLQFEFQKAIIGEGYNEQNTFVNPPYAALIYAPFALLDYVPAYILWQLFNFSLLIMSVIIVRQELSVLKAIPLYKVIGSCFLFFPTLGWFFNAQATPIVFFLYCLCFTFLRKGEDFRAGFILGLLAFKPQLAVGLAIVLIFKWRWKALLGGLAAVTIIVGLSLVYIPGAMFSYIEISPLLIDLLRLPNYPSWGIHSIFGFSTLLFDDLNPRIADISTFMLTAITILFLLKLWRKNKWLEDRTLWDLSMAVTFCWGILISPHLFYYDLMLLLLPAAILVQHLPWLYERNNNILLWTTLVWVITYLGSYISLAQLTILSYFELIEISLQLSTPILFYWGYGIYKAVRHEQQQQQQQQVL